MIFGERPKNILTIIRVGKKLERTILKRHTFVKKAYKSCKLSYYKIDVQRDTGIN